MSSRLSHLPSIATLICGLTLAACSGGSSGNHDSGSQPTTDAGDQTMDAGNMTDAGPVAVNPGNGTGPAATLACASSGQNAFTTYGATAFVAVNNSIFANVDTELSANGTANLGTSFGEIGSGNVPATTDDLAAFQGKLAAYLVYVYGGPTSITYTDGKSYSGLQDMAQAHNGLNITSSQFGYLVSNIIVPALQSNGVPAGDISSCFAPPITSAAFEAKIVNNATGTGAGASLMCASSGQNAFTTYGASAFVAVNNQIFANVESELSANGTTNLGTAFTEIGSGTPPSTSDALATFEGKLAAYLVYVYGGPSSIVYTDSNTYYGPQDMNQAHAGLGITSAQFGYFISNIVVPALTTEGVPMGDISSCFAPPLTSAAFEASIVGQ